MKDRFRILFDLAKPLVAEVVTDARDTAGWVIDKGRAVVDKVTDISPVVIVRKPTVTTTTDLQWTFNDSNATVSKP